MLPVLPCIIIFTFSVSCHWLEQHRRLYNFLKLICYFAPLGQPYTEIWESHLWCLISFASLARPPHAWPSPCYYKPVLSWDGCNVHIFCVLFKELCCAVWTRRRPANMSQWTELSFLPPDSRYRSLKPEMPSRALPSSALLCLALPLLHNECLVEFNTSAIYNLHALNTNRVFLG